MANSEDQRSIALSLKIKYGLARDPSEAEIAEWLRYTQTLIREGEPHERAGDQAARYTLPGYKTQVFRAEADNIEALLRELAKK